MINEVVTSYTPSKSENIFGCPNFVKVGVEQGSKIPTFITDFSVGSPFLIFMESQREHGYYVSVVRAFTEGKYCFFSLEFPVIVALLR